MRVAMVLNFAWVVAFVYRVIVSDNTTPFTFCFDTLGLIVLTRALIQLARPEYDQL